MTLRPGLRWALGVTGVASIAALWWGEPAPIPTDSLASARLDPSYFGPRSNSGVGSRDIPIVPLPSTVSREMPEPAERDIFNVVAPPAMAIEAPRAAPAPVPQVVLAPTPPPPPPMTWRYLGGMRAPNGAAMVYLGQGDDVVLAQAGAELPGGYRIEEVVRATPEDGLAVTEIHLVYPSSGYRETLRVPMPSSP